MRIGGKGAEAGGGSRGRCGEALRAPGPADLREAAGVPGPQPGGNGVGHPPAHGGPQLPLPESGTEGGGAPFPLRFIGVWARHAGLRPPAPVHGAADLHSRRGFAVLTQRTVGFLKLSYG